MILRLSKDFNFKNKDVVINSGSSNTQELSIEDYNKILETLKVESVKPLSGYYDGIVNGLLGQSPNWDAFVPDFKKKMYYKYLKEKITATQPYVTPYFFNAFQKRLALFEMITPLMGADVPIYKHSSITGRLSIEKGINYLTMKKEQRKQLRSHLKDHTLYELDFKSCEPNLYARYFNLCDGADDIYGFLAEKIDLDFSDRNKIKRMVLSILYGANENSVSRLSSTSIKKVRQIKEILKVKSFKDSLESEYEEFGFIKNLYCRPVLSDNNLVNYWIQSSAADFCCLAFLNFLTRNNSLKLHAVIHDAILFSMPDTETQRVCKTKELDVDNLSIPVEIKQVC